MHEEKLRKGNIGWNDIAAWCIRCCGKCIRFKSQSHLLYGTSKRKLKEYYSLSLDKKKSKWRVPIQMLDENGDVSVPTDNEKEFLKK